MLAVGEHFTAKYYVDQAIYNSLDEPALIIYCQDNVFKIFNLTKIKSITLNTQTINDNEIITKSYIDQFHQEKE